MAMTDSTFKRDILAPLAGLGRKLRSRLIVAGLARCAAVIVVLIALQLTLDLVLVLGKGPRAALLLFVVTTVVYHLWQYMLRPLAIQMTLEDIAALVERARPDLRDQLLTAVSFMRNAPNPDRDSPAMVRAVIESAHRAYQSAPAPRLFDVPRHRRFVALGLTSVAIAASAGLISPDYIAAYLVRDLLLQDAAWPSRTRITIDGLVKNRIAWPLGDDLTLVANAEGDIPDSLRAEVELPDGKTFLRDMSQRGRDQFLLEYGPLTASMKLRFLIAKFGVDESTTWYDVLALQRPTVAEMTVTVTPPSYADQPATKYPANQTSIDSLHGSTLRIDAVMNKPIASAALHHADSVIADAVRDSAQSIHAEFIPHSAGSYYFNLTDDGGLTDLHPVTIAVRLQTDSPPKVRLALPGAGDMITPMAVLDVAAECEDNLALQSADLLSRILTDANSPTSQPDDVREKLPRFEPRMTRYAETLSWPLSALGAKVGDQVRLAIRASDYQPAVTTTRPAGSTASLLANTTDSGAFTLRVVTPEELLAELGRRESEWRREFEQILKSQEQLKKRIEDLHDRAAGGLTQAEVASALTREQSAQRGQISRLKTVRRQFEQIFAELKVNQLADTTVRRRLENGVIDPITNLVNIDIPAAADAMERLHGVFDRAAAQDVENHQTRLIQQMNAILANMLKWEGYNEAVGMLRDVIRLQTDVNRQTQSRLEQQAENLFGPGTTSRPEKE
ncbi:MAG: hypothetical protein AABZ08_09125 [Planctomycetota bacterium]